MKSIQSKFLLLILSSIFISAFIIGSAGVLSSKQVIDKESVQFMNLLCEENTEEINNILGRIEQSVDILSDYVLDNLESVEKLSDETYLEEYTQLLDELALTVASRTDGAVAVYVRYNREITPPKSGLFRVKNEETGAFELHELTDLTLYSPDDLEHVGWYYVPVNNGRATWMGPYQNNNIDMYMISYVVPIYDGDTLVGVVGMDIDFNYLTEIVDEIKIYDTGFAVLMNQEFKLVHHKENLSQEVADKFSEGISGEELPSLTNPANDKLYSYKYDGELRKAAVRELANDMVLAISAPTSEIDQSKNRLVMQIVLATIVISFIFMAITSCIAKTMIRPLQELNIAAKKIAEGDLGVSLPCQSKDEIGTLTESIRQTANQLKKRIDYINSLAFTDSLTGVRNNTAYLKDVAAVKERMSEGTIQFAVVVVDVNGLKSINDRYGHKYGNDFIIMAASVIANTFKDEKVYRIGGDEFAVIVENIDEKKGNELLGQLYKAFKEKQDKIRISAAGGVAVYDKERDDSYESVFARADEVMYKNKAAMKERGESSDVLRK